MISFTANLQNAEGKTNKYRVAIEDLNSVLTETGALNVSALLQNAMPTDEVAEIKKLVEEYKSVSHLRKDFESRNDVFQEEMVSSEKIDGLLKQEDELIKEINTRLSNKLLTLNEIEQVQRNLNSIDNYQGNKPYITNSALNSSRSDYKKYIENMNADNIIPSATVADGRKVIDVLQEIQIEAKKTYEALAGGDYQNQAEANLLKDKFKNQINTAKGLFSEDNLISNKQGTLLERELGIDKDSTANTEKKVKDVLSKTNKIVKNVKYNPDNNSATATVINDNVIKNATISFKENVDNTTSSMRALYSGEEEYISLGSKWASGIKKKVESLSQYVTGLEIVMRAWNEVKQGFSFVQELDSSLTTINQTMDVSSEDLKTLGANSIETAQALGTNAQNVLDAVTIYANANETAESILTKATPTVMLANASGADISTASDWIQGVTNQFVELQGQEERVVNSYEKISSNLSMDFAKGINSMADAISNSGNSAKEAGLSLEQYQAIIGKIIETQRIDGSQAGNAMKTILARVSRSQTDENGDEITAEDRSSIAAVYKSVADIDIYSTEGELKNFGETLDELSAKWDNLTDSQKNFIAEESAGVRNIAVFRTLMNTWQDAKQLADDAVTDTDFLYEVQEKHMQRIETKTAELRAQMQEFWYNLLNSDVLKVGLDILNSALKVVNFLIEKVNGINSLLGDQAGTVASLVEMLGTFVLGYSKINSLIKVGKEGGKVTSLADDLSKAKTALTEVATVIAGVIKTASPLFTVSGFVGLTALAGGFVYAYSKIKSTNQVLEETNEKLNTYNDKVASLKDQQSAVDSFRGEYTELSKGVDEYGNNINLTTEQLERYHEICNQIADISSDLVSGYDEQGNAIINLKDNLESVDEVLRKQRIEAANENIKNYDDYVTNFNNAQGKQNGWTDLKDRLSGNWTAAIDKNQLISDLKEVQKMTVDQFDSFMYERQNSDTTDYIEKILGYNKNDILASADSTEEALKELQSRIETNIAEINDTIESATEPLKSVMQSYLEVLKNSGSELLRPDDDTVSALSTYISKMTASDFKQMEEAGESYKNYTKYLSTVFSNKDNQKALSDLLAIDDDTPIEDRKKTVEESVKKLADSLKYDDEATLKIKLGLEDDDELFKTYDETVNKIATKMTQKSQSAVQSLLTQTGVKQNNDLLDRLNISADEATKQKWTVTNGDKDQYLFTKNKYNDDGEIEKTIVFTPIYKDQNGKKQILTPEVFNEEVNNILNGAEDTKGLAVADFNAKEYKDTEKAAGKWTRDLRKADKYYDNIKDATDDVKDYIKENNINTADQLNLLEQCYEKTNDWAEAIRKFDLENITMGDIDSIIASLEKNLNVVESDINNINEAIQSSHTSTGLTKDEVNNLVDAFSGLDGYNYDQLFESTAEGIHLNVQEMDRLNGEYDKAQKKKYEDTLKAVCKEYSDYAIAIDEATTAQERNNLIDQKNALIPKIQQLQELQSRYEGLTNAVTKYFQAKSNGEEGDTYKSIAGDIEDIEELYNRGLVGTNQFKAAVQMMTNENLSGQGTGKYLEVYQQKFAQFKSFFTENGEGAENFLKKLHEIDEAMAFQNADGSWTINADLEEMADKLGISQAAITEIFKRLNDFGFDIDFRESSDYLKNLRKEAESLQSVLSEKYKLDLSVTDPDKIAEVRENAKGLRKELVAAFGEGSDQVKAFDKSLDYLSAKQGDLVSKDWTINFKTPEGLQELEQQLERLKNLGVIETSVNIDYSNEDITYVENMLNTVYDSVKDLTNENGVIDISVDGGEEAQSIIQALLARKQELQENTVLSIDTSKLEGEVLQGIQDLQSLMTTYQNLLSLKEQKQFGLSVDDTQITKAEENVRNAFAQMEQNSPTMVANLKLNDTDLFDQLNKLSGDSGKQILVNAGVNDQAVKDYDPDAKTMEVDANTTKATKKVNELASYVENRNPNFTINFSNYNTIKQQIDELTKPKSTSVTVYENTYKRSYSSGSSGLRQTFGSYARGTVNKGLAFAKGTIGAIKSGLSLVGEVGRKSFAT